MFQHILRICALFLLTNCTADATGPDELYGEEFRIVVEAGNLDRQHSIVSFVFPMSVEPGDYRLADENGHSQTLTIGPDNTAWFILERLDAGATAEFFLSLKEGVPFEGDSGVYTERDGNQLHIFSGNSQVASYYSGLNSLPAELDERYQRGGYLHPVFTPAGTVVTNHLNVGLHPHHSGIWSAWTSTRYGSDSPDFWNVHLNTGRVDVVEGSSTVFPGNAMGGFQSEHVFVNLADPDSPEDVLKEQWTLQAYPAGENYLIFDLAIHQEMLGSQPLILPEYHYGGVGFRGHKDWDDPENGFFLTSGGEGREGHASRVNWTFIGGESEGKKAGITIMSSPENFRHPQPVRIHPEEPFFNYAPQQLGEMRINPGSPYIARYRYITTDGAPNPELLEKLWQDYANPVSVEIFNL